MDHATSPSPNRSLLVAITRLVLLAVMAVAMALPPTASWGQAALDSNGDGTVNCDDFSTQEAAQAVLDQDPSDPYGLDGPAGASSTGEPGKACEDFFANGGSSGGQASQKAGKKADRGTMPNSEEATPAPAPDTGTEPAVISTPEPGQPAANAPTAELPADVMQQVEGCAVVSISAHDVAAAGCPGVGVVTLQLPDDAPPMADEVIITPGAALPTQPAPVASGGSTATTSVANGNEGRSSTGKATNGDSGKGSKSDSGTKSSKSSSKSSKKKHGHNKQKQKQKQKHKKSNKDNKDKNGQNGKSKTGKTTT